MNERNERNDLDKLMSRPAIKSFRGLRTMANTGRGFSPIDYLAQAWNGVYNAQAIFGGPKHDNFNQEGAFDQFLPEEQALQQQVFRQSMRFQKRSKDLVFPTEELVSNLGSCQNKIEDLSNISVGGISTNTDEVKLALQGALNNPVPNFETAKDKFQLAIRNIDKALNNDNFVYNPHHVITFYKETKHEALKFVEDAHNDRLAKINDLFANGSAYRRALDGANQNQPITAEQPEKLKNAMIEKEKEAFNKSTETITNGIDESIKQMQRAIKFERNRVSYLTTLYQKFIVNNYT